MAPGSCCRVWAGPTRSSASFGATAVTAGQLLAWVIEHFHFRLRVVLCPAEQKGFAVRSRRWVVERTFAWPNHHRRLSKDYEGKESTSEAMIYIAMIRLMLRRLARD